MSFILEHVQRPIAVGEVAQSVGVSERQLRRMFRKQFGKGIAEIINERRFNWAAQHLAGAWTHGTRGVGLIYKRSMIHHKFGRQFKKQFGMTSRANINPIICVSVHYRKQRTLRNRHMRECVVK